LKLEHRSGFLVPTTAVLYDMPTATVGAVGMLNHVANLQVADKSITVRDFPPLRAPVYRQVLLALLDLCSIWFEERFLFFFSFFPLGLGYTRFTP
jgi:hypothetical protein